ncbi:MAG TPA: hypothetical protein VHN78_11975, partial [Chloroflexota bacterium]|nr:hypothetical protein [Chloroflexota bacterium]
RRGGAMSYEWFFAWYNLIFGLPFAVALLYLLVYAATGVTFGETDAEGAADGDAEAAADAEADADTEGDVDADAEADADAETEAEAGAGGGGTARLGHVDVMPGPAEGADATASAESLTVLTMPWYLRLLRRLGLDGPLHLRALRYLGVGRVPLSILLMALFFAWGFLGVATNLLVRDDPRFGEAPWLLSVPAALVGSAALARALSLTFGAWLPATETYVRDRAALVGRVGEAVLPIDHEFGLAVVRDRRGNRHQVACRVPAGAPPVAKGAAVRLVDYDPAKQCYSVAAAERNS